MKSAHPFVYEVVKFSLPSETFAEVFAGMSAEEKSFLESLQSSEATLRAEVQQTKQLWQQAGLDAGGTGGKGGGKGNGDERGRALLNRKDFGLVDKFDGNQSKFQSWLFDLLTALESVDQI